MTKMTQIEGTKLLIFDLDNTIFDTYGQIKRHILEGMIGRMRRVGLTERQEKILREKYAFIGFKILAKQIGLNKRVFEEGMHAYRYIDVSKITPYRDAAIIPKLPGKKVLVTSGIPKIQNKKVDILGIRGYFDEVIIDESSSLRNKQRIFKSLLKKNELQPKEAVVVGDSPESELSAGKNLGMVTVQVARYKWIRHCDSDFRVSGFRELKKLLGR
jgi:putative hydrolase of the HAD superfamily